MPKATDGIGDLPADTESEEALIGCLLVDSRRYYEVARNIGPRDFLDDRHREVYSAIESLMVEGAVDTRPRNDRAPIDPKAVMDRLRSQGKKTSLISYLNAIGTGWDYLYYADRIGEMSKRRAIVLASHDLARQARRGDDVESLADAAMRRATEIGVGVGSSQAVRTLPEIIRDELLPKLESDVYGSDEDTDLVATGYASIDAMLGQLRRGSLTILAGRPGNGKTSLAANIAAKAAIEHGRRVLFATLEQPQWEIADQIWRSAANVSAITRDTPAGERRRRLNKLLDQTDVLSADSLIIWRANGATVEQIEALSRIKSSPDRLDLIIIDHLQPIRRPRDIQLVTYQLEYIVQRLKELAMQLRVPVLLLAQINRQFDTSGKTEEPALAHLKDSGAIEQWADAVAMIWRPDMGRAAKLKVAKNRHGPTGVIDLQFFGECKKFIEPQPARNKDLDEWSVGGGE